MKNFCIRLSVLTLALAGLASSAVISNAAPTKHVVKTVVVGQVCPPVCGPRDPTHCGMD